MHAAQLRFIPISSNIPWLCNQLKFVCTGDTKTVGKQTCFDGLTFSVKGTI
jgi:hypothetical protein